MAYFRRGTNYDCANIAMLLYRLDAEWGRKFEAYVDSNSRITVGVAPCYSVRNSVAHGGG
jgi:hypothetical protein